MNVLLIGEESVGIQVLRELESRGHRIVAVAASPENVGSSRATLWEAATKRGHEMWPAKIVKDPGLADRLRSENVDLILNVHSLYIIPEAVLNAARIGAFNLHPGPLPRYAGLNAPSWAIYRGEKMHGATLHKMVREIDAGPIVYQAFFEIGETDTALAVYSKCIREGVPLVLQLLDVASTDPKAIPLHAQDMAKREYFGKEVPNDGSLRWSSPAEKIVNFVRACDFLPFLSPWDQPKTWLADRELRIMKARRTGRPCQEEPGTVGQFVEESALVSSLDEWVLVEKLKVGEGFFKPAQVFKMGDHLRDFSVSHGPLQPIAVERHAESQASAFRDGGGNDKVRSHNL